MLRTRIISAAVLAPILLLLFWLHPLTCLFAMTVMAAIGAHEFAEMAQHDGYAVPSAMAAAIIAGGLTVAVYAAVYLSVAARRTEETLIIAGIVLLLAGATWWLRARGADKPTPDKATSPRINIGLWLFGTLYLSIPLGLAAIVRALLPDQSLSNGTGGAGFVWLLVALFGTWAADTGAYFAGRAFGRHKLAPKVSPSKTIEGAIGGVLASVVAVVLTTLLLNPVPPLYLSIPLGIVISIASILGDLFESFTKRRFHTKDSGTIIPGHGGVLDRIDSLLFAFVIVATFTLIYMG